MTTNQKQDKIYNGTIESQRSQIIDKLIGYIFRKIDFDNDSLQTLKDHSQKGNVVYASFHSSNISLMILYNLLKKHKLELPEFALEYNPFFLQTLRYIGKRIIKYLSENILRKEQEYILDGDYIEKLLLEKKSILISLMSKSYFIKRYLENRFDSLTYLINLQKKMV